MKVEALWKRGPIVPCSAMSPVYQNLVLQGYLLRVLHEPYCCGWANFVFSPVIHNGSLCLFWAGFAPCVVSSLVWCCLGLELSQTRCLPKMQKHQTAGCFPCVISWKAFFLVSRVCSQTKCLSPAHCWGYSWTGVCRYLHLSEGQESLWSCAGPCQGCLHVARL